MLVAVDRKDYEAVPLESTAEQQWRLAAPITDKSAAIGYTGLMIGPVFSNHCLAFH